MDTGKEVLTIGEAADFLRCGRSTLHKLARAGRVPASRLASEYRFLRSSLIAWLREHEQQASETPAPVPTAASIATGTPVPVHQPPAVRRVVNRVVVAPLPETAPDKPEDPPPRRQVGRGAKLTEGIKSEIKGEILRDVAAGVKVGEAVRRAGICWSALHQWRKRDPAFAEALQRARGSAE